MSKQHDPVEAAKVDVARIEADADRTRKGLIIKQMPSPERDVPSVPTMPVQSVAPSVTTAQAQHRGKFRVKSTKQISWNGSMTRLISGSVIDVSHYGGERGLHSLVEQGVELEPITG